MARVNTKRVSLIAVQLELDADRKFDEDIQLQKDLDYPYDPFDYDWEDRMLEKDREARYQHEMQQAFDNDWSTFCDYDFDNMMDPL